jgi:hypothetical protein
MEAVSRDQTASPGPGHYDGKLLDSSRVFTIGEKISRNADPGFPGPGTYDPKDNVTKV